MKSLALALAASGMIALAAPVAATTWLETPEARSAAAEAADVARTDMIAKFGTDSLKPGHYLWDKDAGSSGAPRVVVSLDDQLAYLYRGDELVAVSTISSGKPGKDTPTGIFPIREKKAMHHSRKYDNAPMPHMQRLDDYGIALHAGQIPGHRASRGCVRLPAAFAAKLFRETRVGTPVLIGA
ncbi:L,D-transpeptidase family protein [Sphingomonas mesophila]|uniref:L,D-transpeptidase family protein n=1 Tax=Sphingomonas mesophila TaxID=2303576 RepID=UPI000E596AC2|nr:L,D-transpeptidase family protein [Sphingomonas mesophila]